jgi:Fe-Mn family superoxide dismutase
MQTRRQTIAQLAAAGTAALIFPRGVALRGEQGTPEPPAAQPRLLPGQHAPVPLPFDPKKLKGLSERLLVSHHQNNYGGALRNLNLVEEELDTAGRDTPGFVIAGLKERELTFTNSVILHELYFANLGGDGKPAGAVRDAIGTAFGSAARFEEMFRATAMSLAGGSGWVLLDLNFHTGDLRIYGGANHTQSLAFGSPLLVLDMYEHAYHIDYGAAAAAYVDAFFANLQWQEINRRYDRALKAWTALQA